MFEASLTGRQNVIVDTRVKHGVLQHTRVYVKDASGIDAKMANDIFGVVVHVRPVRITQVNNPTVRWGRVMYVS